MLCNPHIHIPNSNIPSCIPSVAKSQGFYPNSRPPPILFHPLLPLPPWSWWLVDHIWTFAILSPCLLPLIFSYPIHSSAESAFLKLDFKQYNGVIKRAGSGKDLHWNLGSADQTVLNGSDIYIQG